MELALSCRLRDKPPASLLELEATKREGGIVRFQKQRRRREAIHQPKLPDLPPQPRLPLPRAADPVDASHILPRHLAGVAS